MEKSLSLVTGTEQTRVALLNQLKEYMDITDVKSYAIDEGIESMISDDIILVSSELAKEELIYQNLIDLNCEIIVARRTIDYDHIDEIVLIPQNTEVLFVNDVKETAIESIKILKKLGIDHIKYKAYYPEINNYPKHINTAITPGETDKVPPSIKIIYDIGPRIMDFTTIAVILRKLDMFDERAGLFSEKYLHKIINIAKRLGIMNRKISKINCHLNDVLECLEQGLLVYDNNGVISVFNEKLKKILKVKNKNVTGMKLKNVIFNKKLLNYLMDNKKNLEVQLNIDGNDIKINKIQIDSNFHTVAAFKNIDKIKFNSIEENILAKGFVAKYTFDDIIGRSVEIRRVKQIGQRLAQTDLTILIEGESGTGKELFASAIHRASKRNKGPFLAVNFSSLSDELIESELFGYEEGAFTGAIKGGKPGLFEQVQGGTIFLDEIGDISLKVQTKLLRVLQEKEIMRIGGNKIIPINVNVIAATNKNLIEMINNNQFRKDLYYRLKIGYIRIPPLRERKDDIEILLKCFIMMATRDDIHIDAEVYKIMDNYDWYGNIRELKNTIEYMLAMRKSNRITLDDIPDMNFFQNQTEEFHNSKGKVLSKSNNDNFDNVSLNENMKFVLRKIFELNNCGKTVGRRIISIESKKCDFNLSETQVRTIMNKLEIMSLIIKHKGRKGTYITQLGKKIISRY